MSQGYRFRYQDQKQNYSRINIFTLLAVSGVTVTRVTDFDIKIRTKIIEIKYSAPNRVLSFFPRDVLDGILDLNGSVSEGFPTYFIIFITNDWYFIILEIIWYG